MQVREAQVSEREMWNGFVLESPQGSFLQTWEWGEVEAEMGRRVWRLVVEDGEEWLASLLLVRRELPLGQCWLYGLHGPNFTFKILNSEFKIAFQALQGKIEEIAEAEGAVWVRVDAPFLQDSDAGEVWPNILKAEGWQKAEREVQPRETLLLDLGNSEEDLLADMKSKTRYNVRLAERKGVRVRFSSDVKDVELFWKVAQEVSERSGFSYHPRKYYEEIVRHMEAELAIAEHDGEVLAVHLLIYAGGRATYAHGASSDRKRSLMAPALLYWKTIRRAKERGCAVYDFWGVAPEGAGSEHPWAGVTRMKEGFGGRRERYTGAYDLVVQPWLYQAVAVARRLRSMV